MHQPPQGTPSAQQDNRTDGKFGRSERERERETSWTKSKRSGGGREEVSNGRGEGDRLTDLQFSTTAGFYPRVNQGVPNGSS
jgi:hypothetical protein